MPLVTMLKEAIKHRQFTVTSFAREIGKPQQTVDNWCQRPYNLKPKDFELVVNALNVNRQSLYDPSVGFDDLEVIGNTPLISIKEVGSVSMHNASPKILGMTDIPRTSDGVYAIYTPDAAMSLRIGHDAVVAVDFGDKTLADGWIYLVQLAGRPTLRRYRDTGGPPRLLAESHEVGFEPTFFGPDTPGPLIILGKAIRCTSDLAPP